MSHITGLFSRRAFNLEGILCSRLRDGRQSMIYLVVEKNHQIDQIIKQLHKLYDVLRLEIAEKEYPAILEGFADSIGFL